MLNIYKSFSQDFAEGAAEDDGSEIGEERDDEGARKFFLLCAGEIDGADVEHRFGGTVGDAGAAGYVAVGAVSGEDIRKHGGGAVARERLDEHEGGDLFGDTQPLEQRSEEGGEFVLQAADGKQLREHHDGGDIGKDGHDERKRSIDALGETVIYADFPDGGKEEGE